MKLVNNDLINHGNEYRFTWAAIIAALCLILPGFIVGGVVAFLYKSFLESIGIGSSHWIFFLEWIDKVVLMGFPSMMHGAIGGGLTIIVTSKIFKYANMSIVRYTTSAIFILMLIVASVYAFFFIPFDEILINDLTKATIETIGVIVGLFYFQTNESSTSN